MNSNNEVIEFVKKILVLLCFLGMVGCTSTTYSDLRYSKEETLDMPSDILGTESDLSVDYIDNMTVQTADDMVEGVVREIFYDVKDLNEEQKNTFDDIIRAGLETEYKDYDSVSIDSAVEEEKVVVTLTVDIEKSKDEDLSSLGIYDANKTENGYPLKDYKQYLESYGYK